MTERQYLHLIRHKTKGIMKIYEHIPENKLDINQTAKKLLTDPANGWERQSTYLTLLMFEVGYNYEADDCVWENLKYIIEMEVIGRTPEEQMKLMLPEYPDINYEILDTEGLSPEEAKKAIARVVEWNLDCKFQTRDGIIRCRKGLDEELKH